MTHGKNVAPKPVTSEITERKGTYFGLAFYASEAEAKQASRVNRMKGLTDISDGRDHTWDRTDPKTGRALYAVTEFAG